MDPVSIGALASLAGAAGSLFGRNKKGKPEAVGPSMQAGFAALPPQVQQAYLQQYLPQIQQQNQGKYQGLPMGQATQGPFGSRGLQELQEYSNQQGGLFAGGTGVQPLGQVEPFNPYQMAALQNLGGGFQGLQQDLPQYQNLYNQNVLDPELANIQRQQDIAQNSLLGQQAGSGNIGAFGSSALGTQIAQLQDNANRLRMDARAGAFQSAQGLRRQTLADMLGAGGQIQQQGQSYLDALSPQLAMLAPQNRSGLFAQQLGAIPGSQVNTQYSQPQDRLSGTGRAGALATGAGGILGSDQFKSLFSGQNTGQAASLGGFGF